MTITLSKELLQTTQMTEAEMLQEIAVMLYQKQRLTLEQSAQLTTMNIDDFYQLLINRNIIPSSPDADDEPNELILASLRNAVQQIQEEKIYPISELWDGIDV
jgi:predicted HTH domain antitoxin